MKKINFFKLVSLLVVVVFVSACKDNYPESHKVTTLIALDKQNVTLHAGESTNISAKVNFQEDGKNVVTTIEKKINWATSDTLVAKIDANGVVTAVAGGTAIITAECQGTEETCAVLVKDIFVAGSFQRSESETSAVIWQKCDTGAFIKYELPDAEFAAMVVDEQGIYYAGTEGNVAKVWKDGAEQYELGEKTKITSMCIDGGNIYVVGYDSIDANKIVARLWKNGEEELLNLEKDATYAYDVAVNNGNVYVVGSSKRDVNDNHDAIVWTNGNAKKLIIPAMTNSKNAEARTICINNGSIYIGGGVDTDSKTPYIWENEKESPLVEKMGVGSLVKNLKFINNELYVFYGTKLLMGNKEYSKDPESYSIPSGGEGLCDVEFSCGSVFMVGQMYQSYTTNAQGNGNAIAELLKDGKPVGLTSYLRPKQTEDGKSYEEYPKSSAVAIGIR